MFDTCIVCYLLVLPSEIYAVANIPSKRPKDGNTSYHSCESFPLASRGRRRNGNHQIHPLGLRQNAESIDAKFVSSFEVVLVIKGLQCGKDDRDISNLI